MENTTTYNTEAFSAFVMNLRDLMDGKYSGKKETMEELAEAIDVQRQTISKYRSGDRTPDYKTALKIAEHYDVSLDWLVGRPGASRSLDIKQQSVCKYTGLSEDTVEYLHGIVEELKKASNIKISVPNIDNVPLKNLRFNMKCSIKGEFQEERFIDYENYIGKKECVLSFINMLIKSPDIEDISYFVNSDLLVLHPTKEKKIDEDPFDIESMIRLGRQQACALKINQVAEHIGKQDKNILFPYLSFLEKKSSECWQEYLNTNEDAMRRQKNMDMLRDGLQNILKKED